MDKKLNKLKSISDELKSEFVGLDSAIDQIIDKMTSWHLFPEYQTSPLVINLWGITGTGKTELIRSIAKKLEVRFIEQDIRNIHNTDEPIFGRNNYESDKPFIFLVDEFQTGRCLDQRGLLIPEAIQKTTQLWSFLNDGTPRRGVDAHIPSSRLEYIIRDIYKLKDISQLNFNHFRIDYSEIKDLSPLGKDLRNKMISQSGAELIKTYLEYLNETGKGAKKCNQALVFICGNLDEAYSSLIKDLEILEADELAERISNVSVSDAKTALMSLFRAEQVARLGNNHIMFPSFTNESYLKIINLYLNETKEKIRTEMKVDFSWDESIVQHVFNEGVVPSQGIRNLSSIYKSVYDAKFVQLAVKALIKKEDSFKVSIKNHTLQADFSNVSEIEKIQSFKNTDVLHPEPMRSLVAVHEAGHAVLYWLLNQKAPQRVVTKSVHNHTGGYVKTEPVMIQTKKTLTNSIIMALGGFIAEGIIFGEENVSTGAYGDLQKATQTANKMIKEFGMGNHIGQLNTGEYSASLRSLEKSDDAAVEKLLQECLQKGKDLLNDNKDLLNLVADRLKEVTLLTSDDFTKLVTAEKAA